MKKTNIDGSIVELKVKPRRRKTFVKKIKKTIVGKQCNFVGRTERCPGRIVSFSGIIIEELGDKVKCKMVDNYIYVSNDPFEIILPLKEIKLTK